MLLQAFSSVFTLEHLSYLGVSAVSEIAELSAQVVVEVGEGSRQAGRLLRICRPLSIVTVMIVTVVAKPVGMSIVAVTIQMTIPIAVVGVSVKER